MKRSITALLAISLCIILLLPVTAYAQTYNLGDTDMRITVDDTMWYVFTRENIKANAELSELGLTYDQMYEVLYNNDAYMDAILYYDSGDFTELFVRKKPTDAGVANLSNYDDAEVLELATALAEKQGAEVFSVYTNQYKFARLEYIDSNLGYYICEYVTVVNKDSYTLTFQSTAEFSDWEYEEIESIVDSIRFDVDTSLKETAKTAFIEKLLNSVVTKVLLGAVAGGLVGGVIALISKAKRKKNSKKVENTENTENTDNTGNAECAESAFGQDSQSQ